MEWVKIILVVDEWDSESTRHFYIFSLYSRRFRLIFSGLRYVTFFSFFPFHVGYNFNMQNNIIKHNFVDCFDLQSTCSSILVYLLSFFFFLVVVVVVVFSPYYFPLYYLIKYKGRCFISVFISYVFVIADYFLSKL